jgi:hypothetical protein
LECSFRKYSIYDGSKKAAKQDWVSNYELRITNCEFDTVRFEDQLSPLSFVL